MGFGSFRRFVGWPAYPGRRDGDSDAGAWSAPPVGCGLSTTSFVAAGLGAFCRPETPCQKNVLSGVFNPRRENSRAKPEKSRHSLFSGVLRRCCGNIRQLFSGNGQPSAYGPVASSWAIWTFRSSNSSRNLNLIALTEFVSPGSFRVQSMPLSDSSSSQRARWLTCCMASV